MGFASCADSCTRSHYRSGGEIASQAFQRCEHVLCSATDGFHHASPMQHALHAARISRIHMSRVLRSLPLTFVVKVTMPRKPNESVREDSTTVHSDAIGNLVVVSRWCPDISASREVCRYASYVRMSTPRCLKSCEKG